MSVVWARGKHAYGFCARCGFRYPLNAMKPETVNGKPQHNKVCPECWDPDHPQNFTWRLSGKLHDPYPLRDPRPDTSLPESRSLGGWGPVGNEANLKAYAKLGSVTVVTEQN
jgi:hypothetical protein